MHGGGGGRGLGGGTCMRPEKGYASVDVCACMFLCICGVWRQVQLRLQSLNRSRGLEGSAFKGSVSPWVEVIR